MSSWLRKKKQQIGAIHLIGPGGQADWTIPIEFKPHLLVQDLIDLAAEKAQIKPIAVPFFGLYDPQRRYWLYPFRYVEKNEAAIHWAFRAQFKVKNSIELRRLDSVAFEYYIMQCRSDFVSDLYVNVSLDDALRLACLDILRATLRLKLSFQDALKQFGIQHFLPKSARDRLKTQEALVDVITRSFKNFENMSDENAGIRYAEIVERLPSYEVHRFKMNLDQLVKGELISEPVIMTLSHNSGLVQVRQESYMEPVCSLDDISSIQTSLSDGSGKLLVHLNRRSGATRVFSCGSMSTLETFCSMVDGYCRLLVDHTRTIIEGIIHPDCSVPRTRLGSGGPVVQRSSSTTGKEILVQTNGTTLSECNDLEQPSQLVNGKPQSPTVVERSQIHGPISRDEAKQLLQAAGPVDGLYLVRENARVKGGYGLSVWIGSEVKHYLIQKYLEGFGIQDGLRFQTVQMLLQHYCEERDGLCTKLTKMCLPAATKDSPFRKRKNEMADQPPPVPLSPRPNTSCSVSRDSVTVNEIIGEGQFGSVSVGKLTVKNSTTSSGDKVCVYLSCLDKASFVVGQRLTQFCSTLQQLEHKRLVKYYGIYATETSTYLVHESGALGPTHEYLAKHQSDISEKFLLAVAAQVAEALIFLESKSCVHGGVAAHTLLVMSNSTVKISDIGLVAQAAAVDSDYFNEEHGWGRHLLPWLAVECVNGSKLSHASDVWAAGVLLWELFNYGTQKPFEGLSPGQVRNLIQRGQRLGPIKDCSANVYELMKSCWSDATTRLSSRDLCEALLMLARRAGTVALSLDSVESAQGAGASGMPPAVRRHASNIETGSVRAALGRFPSLKNRPLSASVRGAPVHQRSFSDSVQTGQPTPAPRLSPNPRKSPDPDGTSTNAPVPKPRPGLNSRKVGTPSRMDLELDQVAKTDIIDASDLSLGSDLGSGQFGVVRKAVWTKPDGSTQETAVKALIADADEHQQHEFLGEAKAMIELDNPYIVRLLGICFEPALLLVTELVPLGAVNSYLRERRNDPPPTGTLVGYGVQIATGMTYLESHRFVHRDLAARNILVATPVTVKITDFGLSRVFGGEKEYYVAANWGKWPIKWYAPESINYKKFSHKSDVWSYGITLWEIFMLGRKPYGKMTPQEVLEYVENGKRLSKPALCPEGVYDIMQSCWRDESDERPSFFELRQRMEAFQQRT